MIRRYSTDRGADYFSASDRRSAADLKVPDRELPGWKVGLGRTVVVFPNASEFVWRRVHAFTVVDEPQRDRATDVGWIDRLHDSPAGPRFVPDNVQAIHTYLDVRAPTSPRRGVVPAFDGTVGMLANLERDRPFNRFAHYVRVSGHRLKHVRAGDPIDAAGIRYVSRVLGSERAFGTGRQAEADEGEFDSEHREQCPSHDVFPLAALSCKPWFPVDATRADPNDRERLFGQTRPLRPPSLPDRIVPPFRTRKEATVCHYTPFRVSLASREDDSADAGKGRRDGPKFVESGDRSARIIEFSEALTEWSANRPTRDAVHYPTIRRSVNLFALRKRRTASQHAMGTLDELMTERGVQ